MTDGPGLDPMVDALREQVNQHGFIDVGANIEKNLPVSSGEFDTVLAMLEEEGYRVHTLRLQRMDNDEKAIIRVLVASDVTQEDVYHNLENVHLANFTQQ